MSFKEGQRALAGDLNRILDEYTADFIVFCDPYFSDEDLAKGDALARMEHHLWDNSSFFGLVYGLYDFSSFANETIGRLRGLLFEFRAAGELAFMRSSNYESFLLSLDTETIRARKKLARFVADLKPLA